MLQQSRGLGYNKAIKQELHNRAKEGAGQLQKKTEGGIDVKRCTVLGIVLVAVLVLFTISEAHMYQPETGRYLQPDPAEFEGGDVNLYVYTRNNPVNLSDPWGLKTWMCSAPLHALGGTGARTGLDIPGNPLYHQYLCVTNGRGISCGGQDRTGDGAWYQPWSHGTPSDDKFNPKTCKDAEPDNKCIGGL